MRPGLSECARDAACSAEFNRSFYIAFALLVVLSVWITLSMFATVDVVSNHLGLQRSLVWLGVVRAGPIVGAVVWRLSRRYARRAVVAVDGCRVASSGQSRSAERAVHRLPDERTQ
ncbi:hypothetical protein GOAMR_19_00880 [Gordonia amarae NBRC 15530]|uniref:Uncharacterized protein n=1 Tax=Gordonia amarae NBRC 15530 TaxID=1075090 RepID=G7GLC6_9ACTN|nr:hypothetical protein GOAMR_19_00880 [Gordonia amarae NBRC 15530]